MMNRYLEKVASYGGTVYVESPLDFHHARRMGEVGNANDLLVRKGYTPSFREDNLGEIQARKLNDAYIATGYRPNLNKSVGVGLLSGAAAGLGTGAAILRHTRNDGLALGAGLAAGLGGAVLGSKLYYNQDRREADKAHQAEANAYLDKILSKYEKEEG